MFLTLLGIVMPVSLEQRENAKSAMVTVPAFIV